MRKGPRYEVHTKYGWFSLDEGAYQDYLAGKLWITWPPEKGEEKPKVDHVPQNISEQALVLRDAANSKGVFEAVALHYQELTLQFNNLVWELVERKNSEDIHKAELPKFLFRVVDFMESRAEWVGTATELLAEMKETETTPNVVTKYLGQFSCEVLEPVGIEYRTKRTGKSRLIKLIRNDGGDENDSDFTI